MAEASTTDSPEVIEFEQLAENLPTVADWLPDELLPFWEVVAQFPIVGGLIVAGVSYLLAVSLRFAIFRSLGRLADMTNSLLDDQLLLHLRKPLFTTVLYFGLTLAVNAAQLPIGTQLVVKVLLSVIVASWMRATVRVTTSLLDTLGHQSRFSLVEARTMPMIDLSVKLITIGHRLSTSASPHFSQSPGRDADRGGCEKCGLSCRETARRFSRGGHHWLGNRIRVPRPLTGLMAGFRRAANSLWPGRSRRTGVRNSAGPCSTGPTSPTSR